MRRIQCTHEKLRPKSGLARRRSQRVIFGGFRGFCGGSCGAWDDWMGMDETSFERACSGADAVQVSEKSELRGRGQTLSKLGILGPASSENLYKPGPKFILSKFLVKAGRCSRLVREISSLTKVRRLLCPSCRFLRNLRSLIPNLISVLGSEV